MIELRPKSSHDVAHTHQQALKEQDPSLSASRASSHPSIEDWCSEFESRRREIIKFFLLFGGDPSDAVYTEVELRRLSFLKSSSAGKDSQDIRQSSSSKALSREREMLSWRILKKFPRKEREALYEKWGIALNTKQRSLQVAQRLWTDTKDIDHAVESAQFVAKLVRMEVTSHIQKEMFGLSFPPKKRVRPH